MAELSKEFFSKDEIRSVDEREAAVSQLLPKVIDTAKNDTSGYKETLTEIEPSEIVTVEDLRKIPVLRKSDLISKQKTNPPFGGFERSNDVSTHFFQSPGPIYEPGARGKDWGRFAPFLHASGVKKGYRLQNCFSYHLTPAGMMFEEGALRIGAKVLPAGTGQTELQAKAAAFLKTQVYAGTPDFLQKILEKGDELSLDLTSIKIACVGGGPLFPNLRTGYLQRGIKCLQSYATADLGSLLLLEQEPS